MDTLPPIDSSAEHIDIKSGRPSKDFFNWIKTVSDRVNKIVDSLVLGNPSGGDMGIGSLNAEAIYLNGVALSPPAVTDPQLSSLLIHRQVAASTTLVATDQSRGIGCVMTAGQTVTIPANVLPQYATVSLCSFGGGLAYSLMPAAGVTLVWVPSGAVGGPRTLGFSSVATLWQVAPNYWLLSGSGIS